MIIVNKAIDGDKKYIIILGGEKFYIYAKSKVKAVEFLAEYLSSDWYYDALEVELMAESVDKTVEEFVEATDLYPCPKYSIYLPKLKIKEEN